ncbi:MAG TPA: hypothetical protein VF266_22505 [Thermoanaerobaculia bacterium]
MAVRGTASGNEKWELSHRWIEGVIDRATHRTIVMHRITPSLKAGVEWNARANEVGIVANWRALSETRTRPALIFGTSSDRIGTPSGQSYYATVSKSLHPLPVAPYVGISYSGYEERFLVPFGVNVALPRGFSAMLINDGVHTHLSATYARPRLSLTVLAVERRQMGITLGTSF